MPTMMSKRTMVFGTRAAARSATAICQRDEGSHRCFVTGGFGGFWRLVEGLSALPCDCGSARGWPGFMAVGRRTASSADVDVGDAAKSMNHSTLLRFLSAVGPVEWCAHKLRTLISPGRLRWRDLGETWIRKVPAAPARLDSLRPSPNFSD